jgi:GNAT superfamily N-acetyltransferase
VDDVGLASGGLRLGRSPGQDAQVIRIGRPEDAAAIALVHETARRAYYAGEGEPWQLPTEAAPERLETWQLLLADPARATVHCAVTDGQVVGVLSLGPPLDSRSIDETVLELHALYVLPGSWSGGIGSQLHAAFTERLSSGPEDHGALEVWSGNSRALAFYRRRGWTPDGRSRPGPAGTAYLGLTLRRATLGRAPGRTTRSR